MAMDVAPMQHYCNICLQPEWFPSKTCSQPWSWSSNVWPAPVSRLRGGCAQKLVVACWSLWASSREMLGEKAGQIKTSKQGLKAGVSHRHFLSFSTWLYHIWPGLPYNIHNHTYFIIFLSYFAIAQVFFPSDFSDNLNQDGIEQVNVLAPKLLKLRLWPDLKDPTKQWASSVMDNGFVPWCWLWRRSGFKFWTSEKQHDFEVWKAAVGVWLSNIHSLENQKAVQYIVEQAHLWFNPKSLKLVTGPCSRFVMIFGYTW